jgi:hypothetical protein
VYVRPPSRSHAATSTAPPAHRQLARGRHPSETTADDHDIRTRFRRPHDSLPSVVSPERDAPIP